MLEKIPCVLLFFIILFPIGCDNRYNDKQFQLEIQQLDSDLEDRWSTNGVVVVSIDANGSAAKTDLEDGELVSYVIGEYALETRGDYKRAERKSMAEDNNLILRLTDGREVRLAVRRSGDKIGIKVSRNTITEVKPGSSASNAGLQIGDTIDAVVDERKIKTIDDYKKAIEEFTEHGSRITFRTTELAGVKIAAVEALGELGDSRAVGPLMVILERSEDLSLRKPAVRSLERLVELSQLESESPDKFEGLQREISEGQLVELAQKSIKRKAEADEEVRRACISILGRLKPDSAIEALAAVMEDNGEIPGIRFQAGLGLSLIGEDAVDSLIVAFNRGDESVKDIAVSALGNIGGDKARDLLIDALDSLEGLTIKLSIVDALAKIGDEVSITALQGQKERFQDDSSLNTFLREVLGQLEAQAM